MKNGENELVSVRTEFVLVRLLDCVRRVLVQPLADENRFFFRLVNFQRVSIGVFRVVLLLETTGFARQSIIGVRI